MKKVKNSGMINKVKKSETAKKRDPALIGLAGGFALLLVYFLILSVLNSFGHAISQFISMWYWILALAIGFGIQIGLYTYVKQAAFANTSASAEIAATGGISATSMIGCCLHHVTDVIPLIGLSAATLFVTQYQAQFMILGVASNIVGITMMLNIIQKHKLYDEKGSFGALFGYDMSFVRNVAIVASFIIIFASFYYAYTGTNDAGTTNAGLELPEKTNSENAVTITAKPINFDFGAPVKFDIGLNTHQGSLDYDVEKISVLKDAEGNIYYPLSWTGSPPGGHHRSGTLTFPALKGKTSSITLIIKGIYNIPERKFVWTLE